MLAIYRRRTLNRMNTQFPWWLEGRWAGLATWWRWEACSCQGSLPEWPRYMPPWTEDHRCRFHVPIANVMHYFWKQWQVHPCKTNILAFMLLGLNRNTKFIPLMLSIAKKITNYVQANWQHQLPPMWDGWRVGKKGLMPPRTQGRTNYKTAWTETSKKQGQYPMNFKCNKR